MDVYGFDLECDPDVADMPSQIIRSPRYGVNTTAEGGPSFEGRR